MKRSFLVSAALMVTAAAPLATGCVQQKRFRFVPAQTACFPETAQAAPVAGPSDQWPSLDCRRAQYKMAFIEFNEDGGLYDPNQEAAARRLIEFEKQRAQNGKIITLIYIHGWKNNASEAGPGRKPKDAEKFQGALQELGYRATKAAQAAQARAALAAKEALAAGAAVLAAQTEAETASKALSAAPIASRAAAEALAKQKATAADEAAKHAEAAARAEALAASRVGPPVPIVGIYLAWRGKTLMGPSWFTFASLWSRRNTANNIGDGPDLGPILDRYIKLTNDGNDQSRVVLVGHSFGARVLEHAIETKDIRLADEVTGTVVAQPRVDLVLYVNSANDSRLSMRRVHEWRTSKLEVHHPDYDPGECGAAKTVDVSIDPETLANRCRSYPLIVAISSTGDLATKQLLPIANTLDGDSLTPELAKKIPDPPTDDVYLDKLPTAGQIRKHAAAHFGFLQSHVVREVTCPPRRSSPAPQLETSVQATIDAAVRRAVAQAMATPEERSQQQQREAAEAARRLDEEQKRLERGLHPICPAGDKSCQFVFRTLGDTPVCYQVDRRQPDNTKHPFNETPFWIMSVAPSVIKDHGDIWNVSFVEMLGQLMAPRGFFEPAVGRMQVREGGGLGKQ